MKRNGWTFWIVLGVIVLITLNLPAPVGRSLKNTTRDLLAPLQNLAASFGDRLRGAGEALSNQNGPSGSSGDLKQENLRLRRELVELEELKRENFLLRQQLDYLKRSDRELIAGRVLARDISGWWQTVRIRHGASPDVRPDQAVISGEGLVGKTLEVSGRTAEVLLISDPSCRVAVRIGDKNVFAILKGQGLTWQGRVMCQVEFINKNISVRKGDPVVTSGLGGVFPAGIEVGHIHTVEMDENNLHQSADVVPAADLSDLNMVFVVTGFGGTP